MKRALTPFLREAKDLCQRSQCFAKATSTVRGLGLCDVHAHEAARYGLRELERMIVDQATKARELKARARADAKAAQGELFPEAANQTARALLALLSALWFPVVAVALLTASCGGCSSTDGNSPIVSRVRASDVVAVWFDSNVLVVRAMVDADAELLWRNVPDQFEPGDWAGVFPAKTVRAGWTAAWRREPEAHFETEQGGVLPTWARGPLPQFDIDRFGLLFEDDLAESTP